MQLSERESLRIPILSETSLIFHQLSMRQGGGAYLLSENIGTHGGLASQTYCLTLHTRHRAGTKLCPVKKQG